MSTLTQFQELINALGDGENNTAEELRAVLNAFSTSVYQTGDIKEVDCTNEYILANFNSTGLGINERVGWAICNGLNGTKDRNGRVGIGYGASYPVMGVTGGAKTHTLTESEMPEHDHDCPADGGSTNSSGANFRRESDTVGTLTTGKAGGNQPHNNMQPYIVTLVIQKL